MLLLHTIGVGKFAIGGAFFAIGGAFYIGICTSGGTRSLRALLRRTVTESGNLFKHADITGFFHSQNSALHLGVIKSNTLQHFASRMYILVSTI